MLAFGAVAAFRVAQGNHVALQADLTKRARLAELAPPTRHPIRVIDTPGPHIAPFPPLPVREVKDAPIASVMIDLPGPVATAPSVAEAPPVAPPEPPAATSPPVEPPPSATAPPPITEPPAIAASPPPEPAVGGPFAEPRAPTEAERAAAKAEHARKLAAAKKARAARLARQRKAAAARKAAQARAKQLQSQQATSFNNGFGNSGFGGGFGQQPAQATTRKSRAATARGDAPFSPGGQQ
jgi:hypothetical protein